MPDTMSIHSTQWLRVWPLTSDIGRAATMRVTSHEGIIDITMSSKALMIGNAIPAIFSLALGTIGG